MEENKARGINKKGGREREIERQTWIKEDEKEILQ